MSVRSREKFDIAMVTHTDKVWAHCVDPETGADIMIPSFEDLFRILVALARCEEMKYGEFADGRSPRDLPLRFMTACAKEIRDAESLPFTREEYERVWARLAKAHGLPVHPYKTKRAAG